MSDTADPSTIQDRPLQVLQEIWGYDSFRTHQREAIDATLHGRDCLVILPTGGGKSLCYQLPAACSAGLVIVVSPLIALMDDQVASARQVGIAAGALHSMLDDAERQRVRTELAAGSLQLLYCSPERLVVGDLIEQLRDRLVLVAIDEAHCISHWGHDFRPEYRQLRELLDRLPDTPRMALTATATPRVQHDIIDQLGLRQPDRLIGHPDRPNLIYRCKPRHQVAKQIKEVIDRHSGEGGIVYAQTRKEVERLADNLRRQGIDAAGYHAGMPGEERQRIQTAFLAEQLDVVVATIAFGMGIDRSNVRYVIHANAPKSVEHYQQESGRAGRDGLPAECVLFFGGNDFVTHRLLATKDGPLSPERQRALDAQLRAIGGYAVAPVCRHSLLSQHFGEELPLPDTGCGACDVCLGETKELAADQAVVTAQKVISAVWRCEQRFGASHITDVLLGRDSEKIRRLRHDELSVHGLLKEAGDAAIRAWIDQLVVQDLLRFYENNGFTMLALTEKGLALCKGEGTVRLTEPPVRSKRKRPGSEPTTPADWDDVDRELFEELRRLRSTVASAQGVPPYVVFSDATLRELAREQPTDAAGLLDIKGIGKSKAARYGALVLAVIGGESGEEAGTRFAD